MAWTYKASTHSSGNRNILELTSGTTENDLSGLIGLTGVTHYINESHIDVYEIAPTVKIVIKGTLYHNPDTEILILRHTNAGLSNADATNAISISGTNANPAYYYYGTTRTNATRGTSTNSKSTGLIFAGARISNWHPSDACMGGGGGGSTFVGRGGVILTGRPCTGSMTLDVIGTTWRGTTSSLEWRNPFGNANGSFNGTFDGVAVLLPAFSATFNFANSSIGEVINQGVISYHTLREFDVSQNINDYDIGSDGQNNQCHREYEVINSATGSDIVKMWRDTRGSTGQRGVVVTKKEVSFNIKNASGTAIEGVKLYLEDNPSAYAKNATFVKSKAFDTVNGYTASGDSPITRGVVDANGDMIYDYSTSEIYNKTTDASGDIAKFEVLTGVQVHEYTTNDSDGATEYGIHLSGGRWRVSSTNNAQPSYSDWDTANFGGFYRVDRRSDSNSNADDFTFKFCSYGHSLSTSTQALKGLGELAVDWVLFDDALITDTRATTDAYSVIDTPEKFYNRAKAYLADNYAGEANTLVSRDGNTINAGSYDVVVDASAGSVLAISGNTLTIKATTYIGNITTTGTTTLSNGAEVIGTFGSTTVLPWEVKNIEGTSRVQIYNVTKDAEVVNIKYSSTDPFIDVSGTYTASQIAVGDTVRLRVTCVVGPTALLPFVQTGVATTTGIVFQVNQQPDNIYNTNGIDASLITTFTADYTNTPMGIDLSETDGNATVQEIYAFLVYSQTTSDGVDKWFGVVQAIDGSNYQIDQNIADVKIQNVGNTAVNISGGRLFRKDGASVLYGAQGDYPLSLDTGSLVTNIQPQIETSLNANVKINSIQKKTNLIPGLL
jgi:hypothetical protein